MKHGWVLFVCGVLGVFAAGSLLHVKSANGSDEKAPAKSVASELDTKPKVPLSKQYDDALAAQKKEIEEAQRRLREREERLVAEESRVKLRIEELVSVQTQIEKLRAEMTKHEGEDLARLVKSVETMQPKKAASLVSAMEDSLAVAVLRKMKEKKVAGVFDVMEPSRAVALSTLLADRKPAATGSKGEASAPREPVRP